MSEENVPNKLSDDNNSWNMIIEPVNNSITDSKMQESIQNKNPQINESNSIYPSSIIFKFKHKNSAKLKGDNPNTIRAKFKNSLSLKNTLKAHKNKNKLEILYPKKLSINHKISQSDSSFNDDTKEKIKSIKSETNLSKINEIIDKSEIEEMNIENNSLINNNDNNYINNDINFQSTTIKNNIKEIISPSLTSITYEEFNTNLPPFEYINDIWESFIEKEQYNNYSFVNICQIQNDIKESMRCILIDWIISLQNKFFKKSKTLFLTINLIDRYLSKKPILRTKFQLLGVSSLFIAFKYEEIYMKNILDFVELTARAFNKNEILDMEKTIIDLVEFNLDLPLSNEFFDILSTVYKFNKKEYNLGCFLLEAFLLDINCCKYKQSQIALGTCLLVLGKRKMERINLIEGKEFIKYCCNEYKINFDIWKDYDTIFNCAKSINIFYEYKDQIKYREVYKIFNY